MEWYLLKSSVILGILFLIYKILLENTSLHHLKRFYLLLITILCLLIPLITFTTYIEVPVWETTPSESYYINNNSNHTPIVPETPINYLFITLVSIYCLGVTILSFRFLKNLYAIHEKIIKNTHFIKDKIHYVLLKKPVVPHSFLNNIFINKTAFKTHKIPQEVLLHEETHVKQKHSWDILFIEIFQIVFWFNPLVYFIKKSIQLNHEFLADQAVLQKGFSQSYYQKMVLDFSSTSSVPAMVHPINYSSIKKRFQVMKTKTSKKRIGLITFILLSLLCTLVYAFSSKKEVITPLQNVENTLKNKPIVLYVKQNPLHLTLGNKTTTLKNIGNDLKKLTSQKYIDLQIESFGKPVDIKILKQIGEQTKGMVESITTKDGIYIQDKDSLTKQTNNNPNLFSIDPLDRVKVYIKENAAFFHEDTPITRQEAILVIKNNPSLNISVRTFAKSNPIVTLTKHPITYIENANQWQDPNKNTTNNIAPPQDPASSLNPYLNESTLFFNGSTPISAEKAKQLMREADYPVLLNIQKNDAGQTLIFFQGC